MAAADISISKGIRVGFTNTACLHCGRSTDTAAIVGDGEPVAPEQPAPGDISMCIHCGHLQAVNDAADGFRPLTPDEATGARQDPRLLKLLQAQREFAAQGETVKSITIQKASGAGRGKELTHHLYNQCKQFYGVDDHRAFTLAQVLEIAAAGGTIMSVHLPTIPYKQRLALVTSFVSRMLDCFSGRGFFDEHGLPRPLVVPPSDGAKRP